jgi:mannosyltransferase
MRHREQNERAGGINLGTTSWIALLTLGGAGLRLIHLQHKSFSPDEAFSVIFAQTVWANFRHWLVSSEANMALYYLLLRIWIHISDTPFFVRVLSVVPGVATIPAIYFAGKTLFSRRAGIISAALLAVNIFHILYSQEARGYSLLVLLVTCSSLFFARNVKSPSWTNTVWYILTSVAALYTHFFAALVIMTQFVSWTLLPQRFRNANQLRNLLAIAILGSPLMFFLVFSTGTQLGWVHPPASKDVYHLFMYLGGSGVRFIFFLCATVLAFREWWLQRAEPAEPSHGWSFVLVVLWLLLPVLVTLFVSHWKPMFVFRFLIICLPAMLLLFARGLSLLRPDWLCFAALAVVFFASLVAVRSFYRQPGQTDWPAAISYLAQNARPGDVLIFANSYCRFPFDYNLRTSGKRLPRLRVESGNPGAIPSFPAEAQHLWVLDFSAEAHPFWKSLPTDIHARAFPRFDFQRTLRFPGVDIQEFELARGER